MLNKCISNPGMLAKICQFYLLKIQIYVNFHPLVYSTASKRVCISMINPYWASTQTFKSKVEISIGEFSFQVPFISPPPCEHLTLHLTDTQPYCLWSIYRDGCAFYWQPHNGSESCIFSTWRSVALKKTSMPVETRDHMGYWDVDQAHMTGQRSCCRWERGSEWSRDWGQKMVTIKTHEWDQT